MLSSISGTVYDDFNGNGSKNLGEQTLSRTLRLTGPVNDSIITGANGTYTFYYLTPGIYTITEILPSGWISTEQTNGVATFNITQDGTIISNINFGNFKLGSINSLVYNDYNSNGTRENGDSILSGWRVRLSGPKSDSGFTDINGQIIFSNLVAGTYTLGEAVQSGWVQPSPKPIPPGTFTITISSGSVITGKEFGNFQLGQISGIVFNDVIANHTRDNSDSTVANWKVYLISSTKTESVVTNTNGVYIFQNIFPDVYTIREEIKSDWQQTYPVFQTYELTTLRDRKSTRLNSSHVSESRMPSSA